MHLWRDECGRGQSPSWAQATAKILLQHAVAASIQATRFNSAIMAMTAGLRPSNIKAAAL
jgi:hypothetical protein